MNKFCNVFSKRKCQQGIADLHFACVILIKYQNNALFTLQQLSFIKDTNKVKKIVSGLTTDLVHLLEGRLDPLLGELDGVPVFMSVGRHLEQPRQQQRVLCHSLNGNLKKERKQLLAF